MRREIAEYKAEVARIEADERLSEQAKRDDIAAVKASYRGIVKHSAEIAKREHERALERARKTRQDAHAAADAEFDYVKFGVLRDRYRDRFESMPVNELAGRTLPRMIEQEYERARELGDKYRMEAIRDAGRTALVGKFRAADESTEANEARNLTHRFERDEAAAVPESVKAADAELRQLQIEENLMRSDVLHAQELFEGTSHPLFSTGENWLGEGPAEHGGGVIPPADPAALGGNE